MSTKTYVGAGSTLSVPQTQPLPGEAQVKNDAGGYVYAVDKWSVLDRFLVLGTEGGTYYVDERKHTMRAGLALRACFVDDGPRVVARCVEISDAGRAPKNDPAIFALAVASASKVPATRQAALAALPQVCRIPTHLFHWLAYRKGENAGWSRASRNAVAKWYGRWTPDQLAYELVKYQARDGWSHRDALRLSHLSGANSAALRWAIGGVELLGDREVKRMKGARIDRYGDAGSLPAVIMAFEAAKTAKTGMLIDLIRSANLSREMLPTEALNDPEIWGELLPKMPLTACLRNLGNMSKIGLLTPLSHEAKLVVAKLSDREALKKARVHPIAILLALKVYASGHSVKGDGTWKPVPAVIDALDDAFYAAFETLAPTGKRLLFALDVSGSMVSSCGGLPISCAEGAAAMALASVKTERDYYVMGFASQFKDLGLTPKMRLDEALKKTTRRNFGGTDCAVPVKWAMAGKKEVDAFVTITDNETYAGGQHASVALRQYRQKTGIAAKQIVMAMTASECSIADPNDPLSLDMVGFDANAPSALAAFVSQ